MSLRDRVLVIGSGGMAFEYLKVLKSQGKFAVVVGRGVQNIDQLKASFPDYEYHSGGLEKYLKGDFDLPEFAINCVNIEFLGETSCQLLTYGVKYLLVEKPGDLTELGLTKVRDLALSNGAKVLIAYNRRAYSSIRQLIKESEKDGGITSVHFEFTEWAHTFGPDTHSALALKNWVLSNSSHVIDTVFYLIGDPKNLSSSVLGLNEIEWHPAGSVFIGSGVSAKNIPFSYHANWNAPGRWAIEVMTDRRRFYLKPMEKLSEQQLGSIAITDIPLTDTLDIDFKPGLYHQTEDFLNLDLQNLQSIQDQLTAMAHYKEIAGY